MEAMFLAPRGLGGSYSPPADKSITHRALMLAAASDGPCLVRKPLRTGDCLSTRACLEALGACFSPAAGGGGDLEIRGIGLRGFREPSGVLDAENSGTTMRLLAGMLAGQKLFAVMAGDSSLSRRPMARVIAPLRLMGARIEARAGGALAPLAFLPGSGILHPIRFSLEVASAQVKSAVILAALRADGPSSIGGMVRSRDHTERMLAALGLGVRVEDGAIAVDPASLIPAFEATVPGDLSSAAFFIAAALVSGRDLEVRSCGINPSRIGFLEVVRRMGARVETSEEGSSLGEPWGTVRVRPGTLRGTVVEPAEISELIDEVPLVALLGLFAGGVTEVKGAGELRHKESDRLAAVAAMAAALDGRIEVAGDGLRIEGPQRLSGGTVNPGGDHRIAMAAAVAAAGIRDGVRISDVECARVSYPDFARDYQALGGEVS